MGGIFATSFSVQTAITPGTASATFDVNVNEYAVRDLRAYDPHGELTRKIYVIRKQALTADERRILQPWHWMPEHAALSGRQWRYRIAGLEDRRS